MTCKPASWNAAAQQVNEVRARPGCSRRATLMIGQVIVTHEQPPLDGFHGKILKGFPTWALYTALTETRGSDWLTRSIGTLYRDLADVQTV